MADNTLIEWARHPVTGKGATWNIVTGCAIVSPGCTHCYAMKLAGTRLKHHESRKGLTVDTKAGPVWTGEVRFNEQWLTQPLKWRTPRGIFVAAHGDLFADGVTDDQLDRIFAVMAMASQHVFFVLTKRPKRMREYLDIFSGAEPPRDRIIRQMHALGATFAAIRWPLPNVWLGVSVEDQTRADQRIPILLDTPAAIRFISAEPLLGPIDLTLLDDGLKGGVRLTFDALTGLAHDGHDTISGIFDQPDPHLDWVISGGESGASARPMHPDWARALRHQCAEADVPFFFKQWGSWSDQEPGAIGTHEAHALADDGTLYKLTDLAYPDGPRRLAALEAGHDKAHLATVYHTGKKAAGRELDGVTHDAMPLAEPGEGCA